MIFRQGLSVTGLAVFAIAVGYFQLPAVTQQLNSSQFPRQTEPHESLPGIPMDDASDGVIPPGALGIPDPSNFNDPVDPAQPQPPRLDPAPGVLPGPSSAPAGLARQATRHIKVFALEHSDASVMNMTLQQLYQDENINLTSDATTNSLVVRGSASDLEEIEALLTRLDTPPRTTNSVLAGQANMSSPKASALDETAEASVGSVPASRGAGGAFSNALNTLQQLQFNNRQIDSIAEKCRSQTGRERDVSEGELKEALTRAFDLKQSLQRIETDALERRIAGIRAMLQSRAQVKETIVERRARQLLKEKPGPLQDPTPASPESEAPSYGSGGFSTSN